MSVPNSAVGSAPRRSRLPSALAALVGVAVACGLLAGSIILTPQEGWTCSPSPGSPCILAAAGTSSALVPVSTWCNVTNSYSNGYLTGTTWSCTGGPMGFEFTTNGDASLGGAFVVSGPAQIWVLPALADCGLAEALDWKYFHGGPDCAPSATPAPDYPWWNETVGANATVNLSTLGFEFGHSQGVLPAAEWAFDVVDVGTQPETLQVQTALTVSPS